MQLAELQVTYSIKQRKSERQIIKSSTDAYRCFLHFWPAQTIELWEEAYLLCLDRANRLIGYTKIGQGGVSSCIIDPKVVFSIALSTAASGIILAHNHPSGNLRPSSADKDLTAKFVAAARLLDIHLLDHQIITPDGYYSFADDGLL